MKQEKVRKILIDKMGISPDNISWTGDGFVFFTINNKEYSFNYLNEEWLVQKLINSLTNNKVYILYHLDGRYDDDYKVYSIFSSIPTEEQLIEAGIPVEYHQELLELDEGVQIGETYELYLLQKQELK